MLTAQLASVPSEESEKKLRPTGSSCQATCQTGPVWRVLGPVEVKIGPDPDCRTSKTQTLPSCRPATSRDGWAGCQSRHMTEDGVLNVASGCAEFFRV